jgi:hypothetical protein
MAARKGPSIRDKAYNRNTLELCREKIKTSQLINRLHANALGEIQLDSNQIRSIEILLSKSLPNLASVEMSVDTAQPFAVLPAVIEDTEAWTSAFDPDKAKH